jgi:NADH-quinone oxidoreductase subunit J
VLFVEKQVINAIDVVDAVEQAAKPPNTEQIGLVLYTDYVFALEMAAVILLVAIIAAITLAHRSNTRSKRQNIIKQIMTRAGDRVSLVSLKSEK